MRNLNENACTVTGQRIAAAGSPVDEVEQNIDAVRDDLMRSDTLYVGDQADSAGIVLKLGIIEA